MTREDWHTKRKEINWRMQYVVNELYHHGIKGQKWYVRRYQNPDGTLTEAGKERYRYNEKSYGKTERYIARTMDKNAKKSYNRERLAEKFYKEENGVPAENQNIIYKYLSKSSQNYVNRMLAGAQMLKSYRKMTMEDQRSIDRGVGFFSDGYTMEAIKTITLADMYKNANLYSLDTKERRNTIKQFSKNVRRY